MQDLGFSDRRALVIIVCIHLSITLIGLTLHRRHAWYYQFAIFLGGFALYSSVQPALAESPSDWTVKPWLLITQSL